MAITADVALTVLNIEDVSFKNKEGEGVSYREVLAKDEDGELIVLRAQDVTRFDGFLVGETVDARCSDEGTASIRVRKYRIQN